MGLADEFNAMGGPGNWIGPAAAASTAKRGEITDKMEHIVAGITSSVTTLIQGADAITGLRRGIQEADDLATHYGFAIGDDGTVKDVNPPQNVPDDKKDEVSRERERIKLELVDRVEQNLRTATDIDNDISGQLGKVQAGKVNDGGATDLASAAAAGGAQGGIDPPEPPSGRGTPGDNAGWWDSLSDAEKKRVIREHPEWIGNRDGVDFTSRDQANRALLPIEKKRLEDERARLAGEIERGEIGKQGELDKVTKKLGEISAIEATLSKPGERQLVLFGMSSDRAEAAVVNGNLDTADHVAVFTPGLTSNVTDSLNSYDTQMADLRQRTQNELGRYGDPGSVATVTWMGYQAPQLDASALGPGSVVGQHAAERGADNLAPFLQGIDAARNTDPHLTALGHSYGSVTTGLALQQNTGVDDAVLFGSPGMGTGDVDDIKVPDGHVANIEANGDAVADLGRFGGDPNHLDGVRQLESGDLTVTDDRGSRNFNSTASINPLDAHTSYLESGSTSQYNMSVIVAGMPDKAVDGQNVDLSDFALIPPLKIPGIFK
nr:alpha/beta hydrolase [Kibdelosporangium sp. MJ126-NF4]CEL13058.1 hypothetical protein [Kibdelosporangium sp. MJ126-NF4]CTQ98745.1 hypothetical protein [Kibdelosporangium sp. MJ126-NF4]